MEYEPQKNITIDILEEIHYLIQELYLKNLPYIYSEDTIPSLSFLHDATEIMSILSNTGFVVGTTIRKGLAKLGIMQYFNHATFSDECGLAKPNKKFFDKIATYSFISKGEIMHIGDNPIADGLGADNAGLAHMIINSNDKTIKDVVDFITQQKT
jgi:putative hydrolase of the HAD superfamily